MINKTTLWYSFLYRCEHCGTAPKSFECRRCGWLIFFDVEQARTGKDPHAARPAGEVFSTSRKAASERLGQRVAEAEQEEAQWREAASAQAEESKAESAEDELERLFMTDWNAGVRMDNLEVRLRAEIDKENDPVLRQRKLERLEFLLAKYSN